MHYIECYLLLFNKVIYTSLIQVCKILISLLYHFTCFWVFIFILIHGRNVLRREIELIKKCWVKRKYIECAFNLTHKNQRLPFFPFLQLRHHSLVLSHRDLWFFFFMNINASSHNKIIKSQFHYKFRSYILFDTRFKAIHSLFLILK